MFFYIPTYFYYIVNYTSPKLACAPSTSKRRVTRLAGDHPCGYFLSGYGKYIAKQAACVLSGLP